MSSSAGIGNFYKPNIRLKCHQSLVTLVTGCVFADLNCTNTPSRTPCNSSLSGAEAWSFAKIAFDGNFSFLMANAELRNSLRDVGGFCSEKAALLSGEMGKETPIPWKNSGFPAHCTLIELYLRLVLAL